MPTWPAATCRARASRLGRVNSGCSIFPGGNTAGDQQLGSDRPRGQSTATGMPEGAQCRKTDSQLLQFCLRSGDRHQRSSRRDVSLPNGGIVCGHAAGGGNGLRDPSRATGYTHLSATPGVDTVCAAIVEAHPRCRSQRCSPPAPHAAGVREVPARPKPRRLKIATGGSAAERLRAATEMQAGRGQLLVQPTPEAAAEAILDYLVKEGILSAPTLPAPETRD